jgi:hypothetical protein
MKPGIPFFSGTTTTTKPLIPNKLNRNQLEAKRWEKGGIRN